MNLSKFKSEDDAVKAFDIIIEGRKTNKSYPQMAALIQDYLNNNIQATPLLLKNLVRDLRNSSNRTTPERLVSHQFYLRLLKRTV